MKKNVLRRLTAFVLGLVLMLTMIPMENWFAKADVIKYNITFFGEFSYIGDTQVTSENCNNILDGTAKYDPKTKTLYLYKDYRGRLQVGSDCAVLSAVNDITFSNSYSNSLGLNGNVTITGPGKFTVQGICAAAYYNIVIKDIDLTVKGYFYPGHYNGPDYIETTLTIDNSDLTITEPSTHHYGLFDFRSITLNDCFLNNSTGQQIIGGTVYESDGTTKAEEIRFQGGKLYGLQLQKDILTPYIEVSSRNKDDIFGDGTAKYNPNTKKLTLTGDVYKLTNRALDGLIVDIEGNVDIGSGLTGENGIRLYANTTITGSGKLTTTNIETYTDGSPDLTIDGVDLSCVSIVGAYYNTLTFKNTSSFIELGVHRFGDIVLSGCELQQPSDARVVDGGIYTDSAGTTKAKNVEIGFTRYYGIKFGAIDVTSLNKDDILGNGKFSYDPYEKVLHLNGDAYMLIQNNSVNGLTISVDSDSTISASGYALGICQNTTITGPGKLTLKSSDYGIAFVYEDGKTLKIQDANVAIQSNIGFMRLSNASNSYVKIEKSSVTVNATSTVTKNIRALDLYNCDYITPVNARFSLGTLYESNGSTVAKNMSVGVVDYYGLSLYGIKVSDHNKDDILGNGEASYDSESKTLYLYKDFPSGSGNAIYNYGVDGLTIDVVNDVKIQRSGSGMSLMKDTVITGEGKLTIDSYYDVGIYVQGTSDQTTTLTVKDADIDVKGYWGIRGDNFNEKLIVDHSTIKAQGHTNVSDGAGISRFNIGIDLVNCVVDSPYEGNADDGAVRWSDGSLALNAKIIPCMFYDVWVAGYQASEFDSINIGRLGVASYDPATKTLSLRGDIDTDEIGVKTTVDDITVNITKDITINSSQEGFWIENDAVITGDGKLTINTPNGAGIICINNSVINGMGSLEIIDADIEMTGFKGIFGYNADKNNLAIMNSNVKITADSTAVSDFYYSVELVNCNIVEPAGGYCSDGCIRDADDEIATTVIIDKVEKYGLYITGVQVTGYNADDILGDGALRYDPESKTLTVSGDVIYEQYTNYAILNNSIDGLIIDIAEDVTLSAPAGGITVFADTTVTGEGKLTVTTESTGIFAYGDNYGETVTLTIKDLDAEISGQWAICGYPSNERLVVINSNIIANGFEGAFCDFCEEIMLTDCYIASPEDAFVYEGYILKDDDEELTWEDICTEVEIKAGSKVEILKGDINFDGEVNNVDLLLMRKHLADDVKNPFTEDQIKAADFNDDGKVDNKDLIQMRRYLADH